MDAGRGLVRVALLGACMSLLVRASQGPAAFAPSAARLRVGVRPRGPEGAQHRCGSPARRLGVMAAGKGFGAPKRQLKLEYGGSDLGKEEQVAKWEAQYKSFIKRMGKYLTAMSWEGHRRHGRGAIYANNQARPPVKRGTPSSKVNNFAGAPTMYVPLDKYKERAPQSDQEQRDLDEILKRIESYNAEAEFVVIFEGAGLMGADVVKPSVSPPEMHAQINPEEYGMQERNDEDDSRVLAEYWTGGGADKPVGNDEDFIDISSIIAEAQEAEDGVIDVDVGKIADTDGKDK